MRRADTRIRRLLARAAGCLGVAAWAWLLHLVATPWRELGGLVSERWRWLGRFALYGGPVVGFALAGLVHEVVRAGAGRRLRCLLYPPACLAAVALLLAGPRERREIANLVLTALVAYGAGVWARFARPDPPEEPDP